MNGFGRLDNITALFESQRPLTETMVSVLDYFRRSRSRYTPLPSNDAFVGQALPGQPQPYTRNERIRRAIKVTAVALLLTLVIVGYVTVAAR